MASPCGLSTWPDLLHGGSGIPKVQTQNPWSVPPAQTRAGAAFPPSRSVVSSPDPGRECWLPGGVGSRAPPAPHGLSFQAGSSGAEVGPAPQHPSERLAPGSCLTYFCLIEKGQLEPQVPRGPQSGAARLPAPRHPEVSFALV